MIADILLEEAVAVVRLRITGLGSVEILDDGLKLSLVLPGDLAAEDRGDLLGLPDRTVGIQQSLAELIQCGPPVKVSGCRTHSTWEKKSRCWQHRFFALALFEEWSQSEASRFGAHSSSRSCAVEESANSWSFSRVGRNSGRHWNVA